MYDREVLRQHGARVAHPIDQTKLDFLKNQFEINATSIKSEWNKRAVSLWTPMVEVMDEVEVISSFAVLSLVRHKIIGSPSIHDAIRKRRNPRSTALNHLAFPA